jgi:hypothetical protein
MIAVKRMDEFPPETSIRDLRDVQRHNAWAIEVR